MNFPKRNKIINSKIINFNKKYKQKKGLKPEGLWYSCGNSWFNYIKDNDMDIDMHEYIHSLNLKKNKKTTLNEKDNEKILIIQNNKDFEDFSNRYKIFYQKLNYYVIDWVKVSKDFGGIEICPYLKSKRFVEWYYPWDVASGCIWSNNIVSSTKIIYIKEKNQSYKRV